MRILEHMAIGTHLRVYFDHQYEDGKFFGFYFGAIMLLTLKEEAELFINVDRVSGVKLLKPLVLQSEPVTESETVKQSLCKEIRRKKRRKTFSKKPMIKTV